MKILESGKMEHIHHFRTFKYIMRHYGLNSKQGVITLMGLYKKTAKQQVREDLYRQIMQGCKNYWVVVVDDELLQYRLGLNKGKRISRATCVRYI